MDLLIGFALGVIATLVTVPALVAIVDRHGAGEQRMTDAWLREMHYALGKECRDAARR